MSREETALDFPGELLFTDRDEWVRIEGDEGTIGITDYAQDQLGDIVFVELPAIGRRLAKGEAFGVVESVKAVSDLYAPLGGSVVAVNEALAQSPELLNQSPFGDGWMIRIALDDPGDRGELLDADAYRASRPNLEQSGN